MNFLLLDVIAFLVFLFYCADIRKVGADNSPFLGKFEANSFLKRNRRSNRYSILEELSPGNQERECVEEACTHEEAYEIFDNTKLGREFWAKYLACDPSPFTKSEIVFVPTKENEARIRSRRRRSRSQLDKHKVRECLRDTDQCNPSPCVETRTLRCEDGINSFTCVCKPGYSGRRCELLVNECASNPCGAFGSCLDEIAGFTCKCDSRHQGVQCEKEINDCRLFGCESGKCRPSEESDEYGCACFDGYKGERCDLDIDECTELEACDQDCKNTVGGFECSCKAGFILDAKTKTICKDIDECTDTSHGCEHHCINTVGDFHCKCNAGFQLDKLYGRYCEDIDECATDNGGCAVIESGCGLDRKPCKTCYDSDGSFSCICPRGFNSLNGGLLCEDINECDGTEGENCEQGCENYPGGFQCTCSEGYKLNFNGRTCLDVNECISDHGCEHECFNNRGSYACTCDRGFKVAEDGRSCVDLDECLTEDTRCSQQCVNTVGSFSCSCEPGYRLVGKYRCSEINECLSNPCGFNGRCSDELNGFNCECKEGFSGEFCQTARNPCASDPCYNGVCQEVEQSFICECDERFTGRLCEENITCSLGYSYKNGRCQDFDECLDAGTCEGECSNTEGSFICSCESGYEVVGGRCFDINECSSDETNTCQQVCENSPGSYTCSCKSGFELNSDGMSCDEVVSCPWIPYDILADEHLVLGKKIHDFAVQEIDSISRKFKLNFEFRTFDKNGIVIAMTDRNADRYLYVLEQNGQMIYAFNFDGIHREISGKKKPGHSVANGNWQRIIIRKRKNLVRVVQNGQKLPVAKASSDLFVTDNFLYYGGIPAENPLNAVLSRSVSSNLYLQGCFRRIQNEGIGTRWTSQREQRTGCFDSVQPGTFFEGYGYLLLKAYCPGLWYFSDVKLPGFLHMRFTFKAFSTRGRLVTLVVNQENLFTLDIDGSQVTAEVTASDGRKYSSLFKSPKETLLCDDVWHVCDFFMSANMLRLHVDGLAGSQVTGMRNVPFTSPVPLYMGGLPGNSTTSFRGTMQNIKINSVLLDMNDATEIQFVRTHSAPLF